MDDRALQSWSELAAVPILGIIALALIYAVYRVVVLQIAKRGKGADD
jgi:hypothetical protein